MKLFKKKWFKRTIVGSVTFLFFVGGLVGSYFLVPTKVETIDLGMPEIEPPGEETVFSKFVNRLSPIVTEEGADEAFGLTANFDDLTVSWPNNEIKVDGQIVASIKSLKSLAFTIDLDVNYNGKAIDLGLGYVDETLYVATKDLRLKQSFTSNEELNSEFIESIRHLKDIFFNKENEDGMRITVDTSNLLGSLLGGDLDLSSLTSSLGGVDIKEEIVETTDYVTIGIPLGDGDPLTLKLEVDTETLSLNKVDLGNIKIDDVSISGVLNCETNSATKVYGLDDDNYSFKKRGEFVHIVNYKSWVDSVFNLLKTRTIGLDLNASIQNKDHSLAVIEAGIDLDASRFEPINLIDKVFTIALGSNEEVAKEEIFETTSAADIIELLTNFDFNIGLKLKNIVDGGVKEYSKVGLAFFENINEENAGYLTLNDSEDGAVMKAKIDIPTVNYLVDQIPELVENITNEKAVKKAKDDSKPGLFDFVVNSDLVTNIEKGDYSGILDLIKTLKSAGNHIEIALNLASLGFGENSEIDLVLNAGFKDSGEPTDVISIVGKNIEIGSVKLDLDLSTRKFEKEQFDKINSNETSYDNLNFIPGVMDQVSEIISKKQTGFKIEGYAKDEEGLGFDMDGWAQLDYGDQFGFGHITFNEYKYAADKAQTPHTVDISIDNFDGDHSKNEMLFEYRDKLRGKFTLKTFDDIIDLVLKLVENPDTRFTKFIKPLLDKILGSVLVQAITTEDYLSLTQSSLITSIKQASDGSYMDITLSEQLLMYLVDSDLTLRINFENRDDDMRQLKSIEIVDLAALGKTIDVTISLDKYVPEKENPVDLTAKFLDFSDIAVLLEFGINTTELTVYHLTADLGLQFNLLGFLDIPLVHAKLDFYIYVDGEETRVYGKMASNPIPLKYNSTEFVYEPIMNERGESIGGNFHIIKTIDSHLLNGFDNSQVYYHADEENFVDNILVYLMCGFFDIGKSTASSLGNLSSNEQKDPKYENTITDKGFSYDSEKMTWDIGVSIEALTELTLFAPIEGTIYGTETNGTKYLTRIVASTNISNMLPITADLMLENPNPETVEWPVDIQNRYDHIISYYNSLSDSQKTQIHNNVDGVKFKGHNI